jgi:DNA-binding response OmpR family regulator
VLLDLKMADMDGIEVLKILKLLDPDVQVIMLTGHGSATAVRQGLELGAYDYLMKPYGLDDLVAKVQAAFREKGRAVGE